jgi:outer membrane lipoprotein SlyB
MKTSARSLRWFSTLVFCAALSVSADDMTKDAAIGGAAGGAIGGALGAELGDRASAVAGAAVGAALGAAVATQEDHDYTGHQMADVRVSVDLEGNHPAGRHCPPGQAKKGRC